MNECAQCGRKCKAKYCTRKCSNAAKSKSHELTCQSCGKIFYTNNKSYITLGRLKHCSHECKNRKYTFDENYFSGELTPEKLVTLGQIFATSFIADYRTIRLYSDKETLEDINLKLKSNYKIQKSNIHKWKMYIFSDKFVSDLQELGLQNFHLKQDIPREDLWEGLKKTHCYKEEDGFSIFITEASKIALWVSDKFSAKIFTRLYKDMDRHNSSVPLYIVVWKKDHKPF